jgi:hypothetical protein
MRPNQKNDLIAFSQEIDCQMAAQKPGAASEKKYGLSICASSPDFL